MVQLIAIIHKYSNKYCKALIIKVSHFIALEEVTGGDKGWM